MPRLAPRGAYLGRWLASVVAARNLPQLRHFQPSSTGAFRLSPSRPLLRTHVVSRFAHSQHARSVAGCFFASDAWLIPRSPASQIGARRPLPV